MKSNYRRIGDYIREVKIRNKDLSITDLRGINIDKYFMPSVANTIGTDMSKYKVVKKGQFACNRMHVGRDKRLPIALHKENESIIVSPAYTVFEIIDESVLDAEYLMMWFSRNEFDRESWFYTDSDVRGGLSLEDFLDIKIPLIPIEKQREIVKEYNTILNKITLNNKLMKKLEYMGMEIYNKLFSDSDNSLNGNNIKLKDIAIITMGQSPEGSSYNNNCLGEIFYQGRTDFGFRFPNVTTYTTKPKKMSSEGDILISVRAPVGDLNIATDKCCIGRGIASIKSIKGYNSYIFYYLKSLKDNFSISNEEGTIFGSIKRTDLEELEVNYCEEKIIEFERIIMAIDEKIKICSRQNKLLLSIKDLLYAKMID